MSVEILLQFVQVFVMRDTPAPHWRWPHRVQVGGGSGDFSHLMAPAMWL